MSEEIAPRIEAGGDRRSELEILRQAALHPTQVKWLSIFIEAGGEIVVYPDALLKKAEERAARCDTPEKARREIEVAHDKVEMLNDLVARGFAVVVDGWETGRYVLRLTDEGRRLCAGVDRMNVKKPVEVQMQGDQPEVIVKP